MTTSVTLSVGGMTCSSCAARIEKRLNRIDGVHASVNFATEQAAITYPDSVTTDELVAAVEATGYGLTLGVHSRNEETAERIERLARVGNLYVNRNQIGAVVGVQPFGGCGLSGTGPKAGGPHYLPRFTTEKTVTINTTAAGGNASLLTLGDG